MTLKYMFLVVLNTALFLDAAARESEWKKRNLHGNVRYTWRPWGMKINKCRTSMTFPEPKPTDLMKSITPTRTTSPMTTTILMQTSFPIMTTSTMTTSIPTMTSTPSTTKRIMTAITTTEITTSKTTSSLTTSTTPTTTFATTSPLPKTTPTQTTTSTTTSPLSKTTPTPTTTSKTTTPGPCYDPNKKEIFCDGTRYHFSTISRFFIVSKQCCMDEGGYLIIVNSEMEQECIRQNGGGEDWWIGLFDKTWVNGEVLDDTDYSNFPDRREFGFCTYALAGDKWHRAKCNINKKFICELP